MASPKGLTSSPLSPSLNRFSNRGGRGEGELLLCMDLGLGVLSAGVQPCTQHRAGRTPELVTPPALLGKSRCTRQGGDKATDPVCHPGQCSLCNRRVPCCSGVGSCTASPWVGTCCVRADGHSEMGRLLPAWICWLFKELCGAGAVGKWYYGLKICLYIESFYACIVFS